MENIEQQLQEILNEAQSLLKKGNYQPAIDICLGILSKYKGSDYAREAAYCQLGQIYRDWQKLDLAEDYFKKALSYAPLNLEYHRWLGAVYLTAKRLPEAIREFETCVKQNPEDRDCQAMLSLALAQADEQTGPRERDTEDDLFFVKAAELHAKEAVARLAEGKVKKARKLAEQANLNNPGNTLAMKVIRTIQKNQLTESAAQSVDLPSPFNVYQMKMKLKDVNPPVWRRFQVSGNISLYKLHLIIQSLMNWRNYHLFEFQVGEIRFGIPDPEDLYGTISARRYKLNKVIAREKTKFLYRYDFGDGWEHEIVVERILPSDQELKHPVCLEGERKGPPEDSGGPGGYQRYLELLRTPPPADPEDENKETRSRREWIGENFDPEHIDLEEVNRKLKSLK